MTAAGDALQVVVDRLSLSEALEDLPRNDLLPPRVEDKVSGQLRAGFLADLEASIRDGSYRPMQADRVLVPKPRFASRVASLVGLRDRVVFSALVRSVGGKIERVLDDPDRVYWPRGEAAPNRWKDFDSAPLTESGTSHIVIADVAGFYESVDHVRLRWVLIRAVGHTPTADAVVAWLAEVMGARRGIPQGLAASDHLATLYLADADAAVARAGFLYFRHGDDIRVPVDSYPEALRAANAVEQALRGCDLLINSSKLTVETAAKYERDLRRTDTDSAELREKLQLDAATRLLEEGDEEDVYPFLHRLGIETEEPGGYRAGPPVWDVEVAELAALLSPSTTEHAWAMFHDAMQRRPGGGSRDALSNEHFHERIASALPVLAGAKDEQALPFCADLLIRHADETSPVTTYLAALAKSASVKVQGTCGSVLRSDTFMLGWQRAWLWSILGLTDVFQLPEDLLALAQQTVLSDGQAWIERIESAKLLGRAGQVTRGTLLTLWERAPSVYRADLIAAASYMEVGTPWAARFLTTARQDPVLQVVRTNVASPSTP